MVQGIGNNIGFSHLNQSQQAHESSMERIASGKRINSAADDAAGQTIVERLSAQSNAQMQAFRNANDAVSLAQVGDGALGEVTGALQRIQELSIQAASGTLADGDRRTLQAEVSQLQEQIGDTLQNTRFNGISLFDQEHSLDFQVGEGEGDSIGLNTRDLNSQLAAVANIDISTADGARNALGVVEQAVSDINEQRVDFGAVQNRLDSTMNNLLNNRENTESARSRIEDADIARSVSELIQNRIKQQVGIAVQAQGNASADLTLQLLTGGGA